jgi:hypothetical protein
MSEIEPCPNCGNIETVQIAELGRDGLHRMECGCGIAGPWCDEDKALGAWNELANPIVLAHTQEEEKQ